MPDVVLPKNVVRAVLLDEDFYRRVADDRSFLFQASAVVVVANLLYGIGAAFATDSAVGYGALLGIATGLVGWFLWAAIAYVVGVRVLGGDADYPEIVRVIGFAYAPLAIGVVPWLGIVGAAWALFAAVVAIRASMEFSTQRALLTTAFGWAVWVGLAILVNAIVGFDFLPL